MYVLGSKSGILVYDSRRFPNREMTFLFPYLESNIKINFKINRCFLKATVRF
jgi:hypothetical protein